MPQTIYDLLTGVKIDDATVAQLDSATGRTFVDKDSREFWQGILTLSHVMKAARTYPHGLPIPETNAIQSVTVADGATDSIKPTGTEIWRVENIFLDECVVGFFDGAQFSAIPIAAPFNVPPFYITSNVWLAFSNASGSEQTPNIVYSKVGL